MISSAFLFYYDISMIEGNGISATWRELFQMRALIKYGESTGNKETEQEGQNIIMLLRVTPDS